MAIEKPTVGALGWNVAVDAAIDEVNALPFTGGNTSTTGAAVGRVSALRKVGSGYSLVDALGPTVAIDWTTKSNGQPATADTGQPIGYLARGTSLAVASGQLTDTASGSGAGYTEVDAGATVNRLGGELTWSSGTPDGTAALVVWQTSLIAADPAIPASRCHFTITRDSWGFGIWPSLGAGAQVVLATGAHQFTLAADGTKYRVEIVFDGDTAYLLLPDGQVATITDSRIASLAGSFATWENFYTASGQSKPQWTKSWASADPMAAFAGSAVARIARALQSTYRSRVVRATSGGTITTPDTAPAEVSSALRTTIVVPPSGSIHHRLSSWVFNPGGTIALWFPQIFDPTSGVAMRDPAVQIAGGALDQWTSLEYLHTGLTPGTRVEARWAHRSFGTGAAVVQDTGTGRNPTMTVTAIA